MIHHNSTAGGGGKENKKKKNHRQNLPPLSPSSYSVSFSKSRDAAEEGGFHNHKAVSDEEAQEENSTDVEEEDEDESDGQRLPLLPAATSAEGTSTSFSSFMPHVLSAPNVLGANYSSQQHGGGGSQPPASQPQSPLPPPYPSVHRQGRGNGVGGANGPVLANGHSPVRIPMHHIPSNGGGGGSVIVMDEVGLDDDDESGSGGSGELGDSSLSSKHGLSSSSSSSSARYPREFKKTVAAFVFMVVNMIITGISLAVVHETVPDYQPLPDQILDRLNYQKWALFGSEYLIQFQSLTTACVIIFHRHRFIVARRTFLIVGVLYLYRAITMWVTALPKSDPEYPCAPKLNTTITVGEVAQRVVKILTGFGLSVNGKHVYCGDFIYSGHTMILLIGYLVIKEYTPRRFFVLHWLTWLNACTSIILLLLSRGHYTVDVVLAYFVSTRTWATYHTLAGHASLRQASPLNHFSGFWWYDAFCWMEGNVKAGKIPNEYNCPLPAKLMKACTNRMRKSIRSSRRKTKLAAAIS